MADPKPLIPSPNGPPPSSNADRIAAGQSMVTHALAATGTFYGIGAGIGLFMRPFAPEAAGKLAHGVTALELPHPPRPKPALPVPGRGSLLYLAPAPLGVMPPEVYGLKPDYVSQNAATDSTGTFGTIMSVIGAVPSAERLQYASQRRADARERTLSDWLPRATENQLRDELRIYTDPGFQPSQPDARGDVLAQLVRDEMARRGLVVPFAAAPDTGAGGSFPDSPLPAADPPSSPPVLPAPVDNVGNRAIAPLAAPAPGGAPPGGAAVRHWLDVVNERTRAYLRSLGNGFNPGG